MSNWIRLLFTTALFVLFSGAYFPSLMAQTPPNIGDPIESYLRVLSLDLNEQAPSLQLRGGSMPSVSRKIIQRPHPWADHSWFTHKEMSYWPEPLHREGSEGSHPSVSLATPSLDYGHNSEFALGQNNGALWQGRGSNYRLSLGGRMQWGVLDMVIRPEMGYSRNREFDLQPSPPHLTWPYELSDYAQSMARIDMPQRFGSEPLQWFHPGQSTLTLRTRGVALGGSTANLWIGPALQNSLTMSNNAPGFPHLFLASDAPVATPVGWFEGRIFWGRLKESKWFDENPGNDRRLLSGLHAAYTPSFLPELSIGFSRIMMESWPEDGFSFANITRPFHPFTRERFEKPAEVQYRSHSSPQMIEMDHVMHMASFFARWVLPDSGFELWVEWGFNENSRDQRSILWEPVHTRSYVLGFQKRFEVTATDWIVWNMEMTQLENKEVEETMDYPVWYEHLYLPQGYTHRGQVIGAGIGPGSNAQTTRADYLHRRGLAGLSIQRIVHHNDRVYRHQSHLVRNQDRILKDHWLHTIPQYASAHDISEVEFRFGLHTVLFLPWHLELEGNLHRSLFMNRHNIYENDIWNTNLQLTLRWHMPGMIR